MISAPPSEKETERLRKLKELDILDTIEEQAYDDLTFLAAHICETPIALISLLDEQRQWFKSHYGLDVRETPREFAFCAHAILGDDLFIVENSLLDERFHDNPLASGEPHVKFYAGAPLALGDDLKLGTLCVIDHEARTLTDSQQKALKALARQVVSQLELRLKVKELKYLQQTKDEFTVMINHEMRTPLMSLNASLDLLKSEADQLPSDTSKMLGVARRNTGLLINLVNDVLDLAKLEAGKLDMNIQAIDLVELVKEAIALNFDFCQQCGCDIEFKLLHGHDAIMVAVDEQRILQVLSNLISNAVKFTHEGDTVQVSVGVINGEACVNVIDHGAGINEEKQKLLFQRFQQVGSQDEQKFPGTGLGLSISKYLVEMHKGSIGVESIPNQQTRFYITLPMLRDASDKKDYGLS